MDFDFEKIIEAVNAVNSQRTTNVAGGSNVQQLQQAQAQANNAIGTGVAQGAAIGTSVAPGIGTAIGAGVGALKGVFGRRAAKKREKEARGRALADVEKDKQDQVANQIGGIINNLRSIL